MDELADVVAEMLRAGRPGGSSASTSRAQPSVILFVGVNGTGKTTTIGKIA